MSTLTDAPPEVKRSLRIVQPFTPDGRGAVRISETKPGRKKVEVKEYHVTVFRADFGIGLAWDNQDEGKTYHTNLDGKNSTCDCPWGTYGGHKKPCRHVAAGLVLLAEGKLVVPGGEEAEAEDLQLLELAGC